MIPKLVVSLALGAALLMGAFAMPQAEAKCWHDRYGSMHCNNGNHYGWDRSHRYYNDHYVNRTDKILKGGLVGAGIGAGAGYLFDRPVGRSAVLGAGVGAGTQAVRYSRYMGRHPIVKTAAYGALAGGAVNGMRRDGGGIGEGALWGAGIGAGLGALRHY